MKYNISRRQILAGGVALAAGSATSGWLAPKLQAADPFKVGFVYLGPIGDHGWTYQHDQGRLALEAALGNKIKASYVENVPESADAERVIEQLVEAGNKLIFTTSFGYMNPTLKVAKKYPDVMFEHATGYQTAKNVTTYNGRFYEGRYVVGQLIGKLTKSNTIGYIGSFPIPEVVMGVNATLLGLRSVNPNAQIKLVWVNSWFDPGKEADAAKALIDQGADVLCQHTDSPAAMQVAEERKVWAIGQASNMSKFGPNAQAAAIVNNWGPYYIERTKAAMEGKWKSASSWTGFKEGTVRIDGFNSKLPADLVAKAQDTEKAIGSGKLHPFTGPLVDQDGKERLAAGKVIDDATLSGMDYFLKGVIGSVKT